MVLDCIFFKVGVYICSIWEMIFCVLDILCWLFSWPLLVAIYSWEFFWIRDSVRPGQVVKLPLFDGS